MRVLHFITALDYSGAPKGVLELYREQQNDKSLVPSVCVLGAKDEAIRANIYDERFKFLNSYMSIRNPMRMLRDIRSLRRIISRDGIAIVHSHLLWADLIAAAAVIGTPTVHISHIRGTLPWLGSSSLQHRVKKALYKQIFRWAKTQFVAVSKDAAEYTKTNLAIDNASVRVILNGIDTSRFFPVTDYALTYRKNSQLIIGSAGRFSSEKGHDVLIRAIARVRKKGCNIRLKIAGAGRLQEHYLDLAMQLGIDDCLELPGIVADMNAFYNSVDIFVLPSLHSEGLPRVVLEACAAGRCVIATDTEGVGEVLEDGENGYLVTAGDEDAIADQIIRLAADKEAAILLGGRARERILESFNTRSVSRKVKDLYVEMIGNRELGLSAR